MKSAERFNAYTCDGCHRTIVTKDLDEGVTPFMIACRECGGWMKSHFYNVASWVDDYQVEAVWKKEMPANYTKREREMSQDHADKGGLFLHYLEDKTGPAKDASPDHFLSMKKYRRLAL